jgi:hypothetical protein
MTGAAKKPYESPIRGNIERGRAALEASKAIRERLRRNLDEQRRLLERRRRAAGL